MRRASRSRKKPRAREEELSAFAPILADLLRRVPGALAAALVDMEGETVDYWGALDPFDIKIAAAHLQIELGQLARFGKLGTVKSLMIRGARRSFIARVLPDDYALVLVLGRRAGFTASRRAFDVCEAAIKLEAGWSRAPSPWYVVEVTRDRRGRPARLRWPSPSSSLPSHDKGKKARLGRGVAAEVLGTLAGLQPRERGYRVRLATGKEVTLVREAGGFWYADESLAGTL
jgi:hypothetical protein